MEELLIRIALATERTAQLLEQKQPGDTVDMAPSPAEPPAAELSNQKILAAYPRRWGTLNGLCVRYCAAFQSGSGIVGAEVALAEYARWLIVDRALKP